MMAERLDTFRQREEDPHRRPEPHGDRIDRVDRVDRSDRSEHLERLKRRSLRARARRLAHELQALGRRVEREAPDAHAEIEAAVLALRRIWIGAETPARGDEDSSPASGRRDEDF